MKILLPISSTLDLTVAAVAAVALHAVVLGFGFGPARQAPQPRIKTVERCDSVSLLTEKKPFLREIMEQPEREVLEKPEAAPREKAAPTHRQKTASVKKHRARLVHRQKEKVHKETSRVKEREKVKQPEETPVKPASPEPSLPTAISRAAAPAVDDGFEFEYPRLALRYEYEGEVDLEVTVSPEGKVLEVAVKKSSGYSVLDKSAQRQMMSVPFTPALSNQGTPILSVVEQSINFTLESPQAVPE
jgi:protein TonB